VPITQTNFEKKKIQGEKQKQKKKERKEK